MGTCSFTSMRVLKNGSPTNHEQDKNLCSDQSSWTLYWRCLTGQLGMKNDIQKSRLERKEVKLLLVTDENILYIENATEYTHTIRTNKLI